MVYLIFECLKTNLHLTKCKYASAAFFQYLMELLYVFKRQFARLYSIPENLYEKPH